MLGSYDREVPVVERGECADTAVLSDGHDAGIHQAQAKVLVGLDKRDAAVVVVQCQVNDLELPGRYRTQKGGFGPRSEDGFDLPPR